MKEEAKKKITLRTVEDLVDANEWMFNRQNSGQLDAKSADAMNTTLKGQKSLLVDIPMSLLKLAVTAQIKKVKIDPAVFEKLGLKAPVQAITAE